MPADHLGHVHLHVTDTDRATEFYREVLGLEVTERIGRFVFLTFGEHHHDLALQGIGGAGGAESGAKSGSESGPAPGVGLYHSAWEVADADALRETAERLEAREVSFSPVDHGISKALYFDVTRIEDSGWLTRASLS